MLRTRLFLYLAPFVIILVGGGVYSIVLFARLGNTVDTSVTDSYQCFTAASAMSLALAGMDREVSWVVAGSRPGEKNNLLVYPKRNIDKRAFGENRRRFEENLDLLLKASTLPGEKPLSEQVATHFQAFLKAVNTINSLDFPENQRLVYEQEVVPNGQMINQTLEKIHDLNHQAILGTSQNIRAITRDVTRLMLTGIVIAFLISAYAGYKLSRSILRPIQLLTRASRELGEGRLDQSVPVVTRDELGELARAFNQMAAQLQEYRQSTSEKIVRLHRTMETTLASFPDPIFVLDREGRIELKNPAADGLIAGLKLAGQLPEKLQPIARNTLDSGENFLPNSFEDAVTYRLNGEDKFFLPRVLAMRGKDDALLGVAVVLYDVTRFRLVDAAKTDLVATVSHELKSPLTSVRMALHILLEKTVGVLTPKQDELLVAARNDTERLLRILNDLLDLARLEEGNAALRLEPVAPAALLAVVMQEMVDKFSDKNLNVNCVVEPDLPAVSVDRQRIDHVFSNLVSNAIKHSPANGAITLRAGMAEDDSVEFSVTDQGPGVPEEYQSRIFERFFRVPGQAKTGAGLGLSIAREITLSHGGRIGVRSAPGRGATFFVVLKNADSSTA
ncbi:MAG TPA: ATP-binding protein [Candidatus Acidoferrum sp.]|nr:ATP-binding protein [Candidatus Acidoferrum sp.]